MTPITTEQRPRYNRAAARRAAQRVVKGAEARRAVAKVLRAEPEPPEPPKPRRLLRLPFRLEVVRRPPLDVR